MDVFQNVVSTLMAQFGIPLEGPARSEENIYTVEIEGTVVHLVGEQEGFMHIWSFPGRLPEDVGRETLIALLAANSMTFDDPALHLGVEHSTGELMLWMRHPLAELDSARMSDVFDFFAERTERTRKWLASGASVPDFSWASGG